MKESGNVIDNLNSLISHLKEYRPLEALKMKYKTTCVLKTLPRKWETTGSSEVGFGKYRAEPFKHINFLPAQKKRNTPTM